MSDKPVSGSSGWGSAIAPTRRDVLRGAGATAFVLAFEMPPNPSAAQVATSAIGTTGGRFNAFLTIDGRGIATVHIAQAEMGQGISTGLTQVLAEELGGEWSKTRFEFTTEQRPEFINPTLYAGWVITGGSTSIKGFYLPMRKAGAAAREMLIAAAARQWGVAAADCTAANSTVAHAPSKRAAGYGELAAAAARETLPPEPKLKAATSFTLIGKPLPRLDVPAKTTGEAQFGIDAEIPGQLFAAVRHGPAMGSTVASIDDAEAKSMPGVRLVMTVPQGVAVVADSYWQARKALAVVNETYGEHVNARASSATIDAALKAALDQAGMKTPGGRGDTPAAMKSATRVLEAEYTVPLMAHACMEPVSCTAEVRDGRCSIWLSTQSVTLDAGFAAEAAGVDASNVTVHNTYMGGAFGRRTGREHITEAVLLAKAAGRPVKVVWSREEDLRVDQHRSAFRARVRIGLGTDGMPVAYEAKLAGMGFWQSQFTAWWERMKKLDVPMFGLVGTPYAIPNEAGEYVAVPMPVRIGPWRGNNESHNLFFTETIIDEAAHAAGQDPLLYRRRLVEKDARTIRVLDRAAELSGWAKSEPGRFKGVALMVSDRNWRCRLAHVVEVSLQSNRPRIERVTCVCDSGLVINPTLARQNLEGGIVFGLSTAMREQITLAGGAPEQTNFDTYELLRIDETPEIVVELIQGSDEPGAFGEVASPAVAPALGNALFRAIGRRLRALPFAANGVRFA